MLIHSVPFITESVNWPFGCICVWHREIIISHSTPGPWINGTVIVQNANCSCLAIVSIVALNRTRRRRKLYVLLWNSLICWMLCCAQHTIALPIAIIELRAFGPHELKSRVRSILLLLTFMAIYLSWIHYVAANSGGIWPYELFQGTPCECLCRVFNRTQSEFAHHVIWSDSWLVFVRPASANCTNRKLQYTDIILLRVAV